MTKTKMHAECRVLWMDDNSSYVRDVAESLDRAGWELCIDVAASIAQAREMLTSGRYCALVADCRMDDDAPAANNGAEFVRIINDQYPALPTFVLTSYLNDPLYADALRRARPLMAASKLDPLPKKVTDMPLLRALRSNAQRYMEVRDEAPERVSLEVFIRDVANRGEIIRLHSRKHWTWIEREMLNKKLLWCVVCGSEVVAGSSDLATFPEDEELMRIGERARLVPFVYSLPAPIESIASVWASTRYADDWYPTVAVEIGSKQLSGDLDTGAFQTHVPDWMVQRGLFAATQQSAHLGRKFEFFTSKTDLVLSRESGERETVRIAVCAVCDWERSPFVEVNPRREALIGRDVLRASASTFELCPTKRLTHVRRDSRSTQLFDAIEPYKEFRLMVSDIHELFVEQCGSPDGVPIVFLHGGPGSGSDARSRRLFDPNAYSVTLFDQRGCGRSRPHCSVEQNTTQELVDDIEKIRNAVGVKNWIVFGGSWGSTLALAYAQKYPHRVRGLVLRGVFMLRRKELHWFYEDGAGELYADAWEEYLAPIPDASVGNRMKAYANILRNGDAAAKRSAAKAWMTWEMKLSTLVPDLDRIAKATDPSGALAFATIENHYFANGGFFSSEDQLLLGVNHIRHLPCIMVQGRYDLVCPMRTAWDLKQVWPEAELRIIDAAGHSAFDPNIQSALLQALQDATKW